MPITESTRKIVALASKTLEEPKEYVDSYVAFLDILGFKETVRKSPSEDIKNLFDDVRSIISIYSASDFLPSIPQEVRNNIKISILSDSIIVSIASNIPRAFYGLFLFCLCLQYKFVGKAKPILIRGSICRGGFYRFCDAENELTIVYGPALVEAFLSQENVAIYPRIIINEPLLIKEKDLLEGEELKTINAFTKEGDDEYPFIDYLKMRVYFNREKCKFLKDHLLFMLKEETDERIKQKMKWLKNYYNKTLESSINIIGKDQFNELLVE